MLTLFYSPHGTSVDNEARRASGHADVPLSVLGRQQAWELGQHYAAEALYLILLAVTVLMRLKWVNDKVRRLSSRLGKRGDPLYNDGEEEVVSCAGGSICIPMRIRQGETERRDIQ